MKVLVPIISGLEGEGLFVEAVTNKVDEIIILQVVDKEFHSNAGSAMGEVRQLRAVADELRRAVGAKKKKCVELTEWGSTIQKIVSVSLLQKPDRVYLVRQDNQFFDEITSALSKKKIKFEVVGVVKGLTEEEKKKLKKKSIFGI